jgi:hypothetical protein
MRRRFRCLNIFHVCLYFGEVHDALLFNDCHLPTYFIPLAVGYQVDIPGNAWPIVVEWGEELLMK